MDNLYDVNLEGIGKINGGKYKNIKIVGVGKILNDITCEVITLDGVCRSYGNISCNDILIQGTLSSDGSIEANGKISIMGEMKFRENIQGHEININGKIQVSGLLSGDIINLSFIGKNNIKEIGGEVVTALQEKKSFINGIIIPNRLVSESIEGDIIILENTECDIVRGKKITIKSGCKIKKIEYTDEISIDDKSKVEDIVKI